MLLVIDIGNSRVKWALADTADLLSEMGACLHAEIAASRLAIVAKKATKVFVANVADEEILNKINQLVSPLPVETLQVTNHACGVENLYDQPKTLGADRWAATVAAWHITQKPTIIVNAGTAVTIDSLNIIGAFLGGTIQPGLRLMQETLKKNTAQLLNADGNLQFFPKNTADAVFSGCMNAIVSAILMQLERQTAHYGKPPAVILTGGDAHKIAEALKLDAKQVIIIENLVLQGLVLLEKESR